MDKFVNNIDPFQIGTTIVLGLAGWYAGKKFMPGKKYAPWVGAAAGLAVGYFGYGLVIKKEAAPAA